MIIKGNKKAFTIIELIVVIAVLGILVLLGMPKLVGYTTKAQLVRIQHDTKIMQDKMEEALSKKNVNFNDWDDNAKDLGILIMRKQLYETKGVVKSIDKSHIKYPKYNWASIDGQYYASLVGYEDVYGEEILLADIDETNLGVGGPVISEEKDGYGYKIIPDKYKSEIKTRLKGTFYSNAQGKVYYEPDKPIKGGESEIVPNCVVPQSLDYEFEHLTGTIVKYTGTSQYLVIPNSFLVDGKCWPVKIIGKGAFSRNMPPPPIREVILPSALEKIEEDAFKDNEIESIIIPPGVTDVGSGAFAGNNLGVGGGSVGSVTIQRPEGSVNIGPGAFDSVSPIYKPSTNKDVGVSIKPNRDSDGNIITGTGGRPTGSISGSWGSYASSGNQSSGNSIGESSGNISSGGNVIVIPDIIVVDDVEVEITEIDKGVFQGEGIIHVTMPLGLERIEDFAFAGNQLIGINIPQKVNYIGNYAFGYNELYNGKEYKWTIGYINFKNNEQLPNVDKKIGSIVDNSGNKINNLLDAKLLNYIWIDSSSSHLAQSGVPPVDNVANINLPTLAYPGEAHKVSWSPIVDWGEDSASVKNRYRLEYRYEDTDDYKLLDYIDKGKESYDNYINISNNKTKIQYRVRAENIAGYTEWIESDIISVQKDSRFQSIGADTYVVPSDGVYHLAIGGARGGKGGNFTPDSNPPKTYSGGSGGSGATVGGIFELKEGDVLNINIGGAGSSGRNGGRYSGTPSDGSSGGESSVYLNGIKLISARGGGGGRAATYSRNGYAGSTGGGSGSHYVSPIGTSSIEGVSISSGQGAIRLKDESK